MEKIEGTVCIVGTGFVADLYMRSLKTYPNIKISGVFDHDASRLETFCSYWDVPRRNSLDELLADDATSLVLNLTNPHAHFTISKAALDTGHHVYSEKPLATEMADAHALHKLANDKNLLIGSAPCSWMSESAQTVWKAIADKNIGTPRLVYAELDDDFIPQAPYKKWASESGAPWPAEDEFKVGCTLEHAGYYLTWLMAIFGPVETVVAASADIIPEKLPDGEATAPDFSCAILFFKSGMVARLTCSIIAKHDHQMRIFGDDGVLEINECWDNEAVVRVRKRFVLRRKLINSPFAKRIKIKNSTHPKVKRTGAASMNFALGPADMLLAINKKEPAHLTSDFSLHVNEVTLAIQNSGSGASAQTMTTSFSPVRPMPWASHE